MVWRRTQRLAPMKDTMNTMRTTSTSRAALQLGLLVLVACGGDPPTQTPIPTQMAAEAGSDQVAPIGSPLPEPLAVRVIDAAGDPVAGVEVGWSVLDGGGTIAPTTPTS